jgi:hypothetical protein
VTRHARIDIAAAGSRTGDLVVHECFIRVYLRYRALLANKCESPGCGAERLGAVHGR